MAVRVKVVSQIDERNTSIVKFFIVMGNEVRQVGYMEMIPGTGYADGLAANEAIVKVLTKVYSKRIKELQG